MSVLSIARTAHQAYALEHKRLFPALPIAAFDELEDDATQPWVEAADLVLAPPARDGEPITVELEVPLRPRTAAETGKVLKPEPPKQLQVRRSLARDELAVLEGEPWRRNLLRIERCTGIDPVWIDRLSVPDAELLHGLLMAAWPTLQGDMYGAWAEAEELRRRLAFVHEASRAELDALLARERERDEGPREALMQAIATRMVVLDSASAHEGEPSTPREIPSIPTWDEVVADEDTETLHLWREAAFAAAQDEGGQHLRLFTPGAPERLIWKRPLVAADMAQLKRFRHSEEGMLSIAARVCGVDHAALLELHHDDYERVGMWVVEHLGKLYPESGSSNGPKLSQKLGRYSKRGRPSKRPSTS